jgi:hypothetical protein
LGSSQDIYLNLTNAAGSQPGWCTPTSTQVTVIPSVFNASETYVAYLFAHDAGGFGLTGTDNVISCGSYTGNGSITGPVINLGYEPQWLMIKYTSGAGQEWGMFDNMRDMSWNNTAQLYANTSGAETSSDYLRLSATGFQLTTATSRYNLNGGNYIYIAIRRGPMAVPTTSTGLYSANRYQYSGSSGLTLTTVLGAAGGYGGFPTDLVINTVRSNTGDTNRQFFLDRLRGSPGLRSVTQGAEFTPSTLGWDNMLGLTSSGGPYYTYFEYVFTNFFFKRAPSFFDEVCYTGTGGVTTISHNLTVAPELMIVKCRSAGGSYWTVYAAPNGNTNYVYLNATNATAAFSGYWNNTSPTASVFTLGAGNGDDTNATSATYVAYLFATCAGVSKVGSYTGTSGTQTINCGFAGGARWVMIKRTDSTGDWQVFDTVDGMVAGTNRRIAMNTTNAEENNNWVYTVATGFQIVTAESNVNASGGTYIFLAIA